MKGCKFLVVFLLTIAFLFILLPWRAEARPDDPRPPRAPARQPGVYFLKWEGASAIAMIRLGKDDLVAIFDKRQQQIEIHPEAFRLPAGASLYRAVIFERAEGKIEGLWLCVVPRRGKPHVRYFSLAGSSHDYGELTETSRGVFERFIGWALVEEA